MDLAPPGLDELFGVLTLVDSLLRSAPPPYDLVVVDTAPTGHALRLLAMPAGALDWVHALLAILLKYRAVLGLGELASDLLDVARELRALSALLRDPARTRVVVVARPAALPRLETIRLLRGLKRLAIPVGGLVVNAVTPPGCARCRRAVRREARERTALEAAARSAAGRQCAIITSPAESPPPGGAAGLREWLRRWQWRA
jgi:arsenite-transporting ATPase